MKKTNLWIFCGPPAAGKSYWANKHISKDDCYVSRDKIRFTMVSDQEHYFEHETEVFNIFVNEIQNGIDNRVKNVYADATHLTEKSRNKLLDRLNLESVNINIINFMADEMTCLTRNDKREGLAKVPRGVIRRMYRCFNPVYGNEKHIYNKIKFVDKNGNEMKEYRCDKCSKEMYCNKNAFYPCGNYHRDAPDGGYYG